METIARLETKEQHALRANLRGMLDEAKVIDSILREWEHMDRRQSRTTIVFRILRVFYGEHLRLARNMVTGTLPLLVVLLLTGCRQADIPEQPGQETVQIQMKVVGKGSNAKHIETRYIYGFGKTAPLEVVVPRNFYLELETKDSTRSEMLEITEEEYKTYQIGDPWREQDGSSR